MIVIKNLVPILAVALVPIPVLVPILVVGLVPILGAGLVPGVALVHSLVAPPLLVRPPQSHHLIVVPNSGTLVLVPSLGIGTSSSPTRAYSANYQLLSITRSFKLILMI